MVSFVQSFVAAIATVTMAAEEWIVFAEGIISNDGTNTVTDHAHLGRDKKHIRTMFCGKFHIRLLIYNCRMGSRSLDQRQCIYDVKGKSVEHLGKIWRPKWTEASWIKYEDQKGLRLAGSGMGTKNA